MSPPEHSQGPFWRLTACHETDSSTCLICSSSAMTLSNCSTGTLIPLPGSHCSPSLQFRYQVRMSTYCLSFIFVCDTTILLSSSCFASPTTDCSSQNSLTEFTPFKSMVRDCAWEKRSILRQSRFLRTRQIQQSDRDGHPALLDDDGQSMLTVICLALQRDLGVPPWSICRDHRRDN